MAATKLIKVDERKEFKLKLSDEEWEDLQYLRYRLGRNMSAIIRDAIRKEVQALQDKDE